MAGKSISNAVRKIAEKAIAQKYPNAGMYAVDKARGEGRSVISAAQHARYSENLDKANQQAIARRKANTAAIGKASRTIQAIDDAKKQGDLVGADRKMIEKVVKQMRKGDRPEVNTKTSGLQGRDGVLGGQHAGGHSDVSGMSTTNIGGEILKTPIVKPSSSKNK